MLVINTIAIEKNPEDFSILCPSFYCFLDSYIYK